MHPNAELIDRLYRSLAAHDPAAMAECYNPDATFEDIEGYCRPVLSEFILSQLANE